MPTSNTSAVYRPGRADQRAARQILANQRAGETSPVLDNLAAGPLSGVVRFLAGCKLNFVLLAMDERRKFYAYGSPTRQAVVQLGLDLLGDQPVVDAGREIVPSEMDRLRLPWVEMAVEQISDGLYMRDIYFLLGWQLHGDEHARLDHSLGVPPERIREELGRFLSERLRVELSVSASGVSSPGD